MVCNYLLIFSERDDSDKENVQDPMDSVTEVTEIGEAQVVTSKNEEKTEVSNDSVINDGILQMMGEDPNVIPGNSVRLHTEIKNRWKAWMIEGLPEETRKTVLKKYPRKVELYAEPPKINLEIAAAITEISKKRDQHFVETQECVGSAIVALGGAVSMLLHDSEEGVRPNETH